ncbi:DNA-binding protein [Lysobacter sp. CA199]|uniref:DNA-binding protein n=1 Tax=Lysobacter sp. CA199 TaxID=3455608 RepID=UPI003F8D8319
MTPSQLKAKFRREGRTFSDWARQNGFKPDQVSRVVNGRSPANYGKAHEIAVALGLKPQS